ncbi:GAF domain-containing sensor histidine kinase [Lusitaniella coriacea]|uniref:GAF domain-containing sensor histidine kinase n=1 Tax=Lusitaniella coriacea TaxID=1983105 RepID=UPI003CE76D0D
MVPIVRQILHAVFPWMGFPKPSKVLLMQKIVERIRNSLEINIVLQTTVDEIAQLLKLDYCSFWWYLEETQQVRVSCEWMKNSQFSRLGEYPVSEFEGLVESVASGNLIANSRKTQGKSLWERGKQRLATTFLLLRHEPPSQQILGFQSSLLIPVRGRAGEIGFIACFNARSRLWSEREIDLLQSIVQPLEIAIAQAKLYEQTQQQAIRERLVNQITAQTRASLDLETILTQAIAQLRNALKTDRCLIHLVENSQWDRELDIASTQAFRRQHLYETCCPPFPTSIEDFDTHGPVTQWVIQHKKTVVIPDVSRDRRIGNNNLEYQKAQIKSSLAIPVQSQGILYAIVYLNQCSNLRNWSKNDRQLAQAVADQLAISIQQAHLYAQVQTQAARSNAQAQRLSQTLKELQLTQAQLIQSEKIVSMGQMVAGIAHEINNPVSFIYGNIPFLDNYVRDLIRLIRTCQAVQETQPNPLLQTVMEEIEVEWLLDDLPQLLESMKVGTKRIQDIVQLLQDFSSQNQSSFKSVDLHAALENTLSLLERQIVPKIRIERQYDKLPLVECYPKALNQVFLDLLLNAIEALNRSNVGDPSITLKTQIVPAPTGGWQSVRIVIADNGPGIPPELHSSIFNPFFTTKDVGQGRGLGLTTSYHAIVSQHQGQLTLNSQPHQGTEAIIEIPIARSEKITSELTPPTALPYSQSLHREATPQLN